MELLQKQFMAPRIVLIVDDNPTIRTVVAWTLQFDGFQPVEAANGLEAVKWMEQAASEQLYPSVILLDVVMPGMDGRAFLEWVQFTWIGRYPAPVILLMTGSEIDNTLLTHYSFVKQIVAKPFHVRDLQDVIRHWSADG